MKPKMFFSLILFLPALVLAAPLDPRFYANQEFENQFPGAFALQAESQGFVAQSFATTMAAGDALIEKIQQSPELASAVQRFPSLTEAEKIQTMNQVFDLQTAASGFMAPVLVLDNEARQSTYFDFDPANPSPGKVILDPAKLFQDANPYAALLFLIHETRHSQQFQLAFAANPGNLLSSSQAYKASFVAQKQVFDQRLRISYCDFLTLNNEYEAFLFGNYVMEKLTDGLVETSDMGTYASQYVPGVGLRIDLPKLSLEVGPQNLLNKFNELELTQYNEIFGSPQ